MHLGVTDRLDADVGAVAAGQRADRLDRVGLAGVDHVGGAERRRPLELARVEVDGDDRGRPGELAPAMAAHPTPPQPKTATESPGPTSPVNMAAPSPAITPQPSSPAASGRAAGFTLVHWPAATSVFSANAPMPSAGDSGVPSARVIFCVALCVAKQYQGRPSPARTALAAHGPPVQDHEVARRARPLTPAPTASTTPAASWPSRNGKSSLMPPSR